MPSGHGKDKPKASGQVVAQVGAVRGIVNLQLMRGEARALCNALLLLGEHAKGCEAILEGLQRELDPKAA